MQAAAGSFNGREALLIRAILQPEDPEAAR
jgi:hypothetical protein